MLKRLSLPGLLLVAACTARRAGDAIEGRGARQEPFAWASKVEVAPEEKHFKWIRKLTSDGTHAEAYFSPDGRKLILMGLREGDKADQIYSMDLESGTLKRLSTGKGKST